MDIIKTRKLTRDVVVSSTDRGDLVGVYWKGTDGDVVLFELPLYQADELITVWNEAVDFKS